METQVLRRENLIKHYLNERKYFITTISFKKFITGMNRFNFQSFWYNKDQGSVMVKKFFYISSDFRFRFWETKFIIYYRSLSNSFVLHIIVIYNSTTFELTPKTVMKITLSVIIDFQLLNLFSNWIFFK